MNVVWTRLRFASPRGLTSASLLALAAALVFDKVGPRGRFDDFFTGLLFGLSIGIGVFALAAYRRGRARR